MTTFKIGDRVRIKGTKRKGTVTCVYVDRVFVERGYQTNTICSADYHPELLIKLKTRKKGVRVTKEQLAKAWDKSLPNFPRGLFDISDSSLTFKLLCKELGLE